VFAYNEERTIQSTVLSILAQDCSDRIVAVLVGANGCTDGTVARVIELAQSDARVKLIDVPERGKANMWNVFRQAVDTPIGIFVDGDEVVSPSTVRQLVEVLEGDRPLIFATGRSQEVYGGTNYMSWALAAPEEPPTGISGRLYAANMANLENAMARGGYEEMPPRVIHEDLFLTCLVEHQEWRHVPAATCRHPAPRLGDRFGREVRSFAALRQLETEFPCFERRLKELTVSAAGGRSRLARWKTIRSPLKRAVLLSSYPLRRMILSVLYPLARWRGVRFYETGEYRHRWIRVESEKVALAASSGVAPCKTPA
jgi:hypothetical protein